MRFLVFKNVGVDRTELAVVRDMLAVGCRLDFCSEGHMDFIGKSIYFVLLLCFFEVVKWLGLTGHAWEYS